MELSELGEEFDVVVYGTGLTECLVAGALSRAGKAVLHVDKWDYSLSIIMSFVNILRRIAQINH